MTEFEIPYDPDFTSGLRSEVYLELLHAGLLDGQAHKEIAELRSQLSEAREALKAYDDLSLVIETAVRADALRDQRFEPLYIKLITAIKGARDFLSRTEPEKSDG